MSLFSDEETILSCFHVIIVTVLLGLLLCYILGGAVTMFLVALFINLVCVYFYEEVINYIIRLDGEKKFFVYFIFHTIIFSSLVAMFYFVSHISWE